MNIGIYKITNPKGKVYVGQSRNLIKRKNGYKNLRCKNQTKLYNSLKKYGWENHIFEIIEECPLKLLNKKEIYYINEYNSIEEGLNLRGGGVGGGSLSQETKDKISKALKGRPNTWIKKGRKFDHIYTEDQLNKMRKPRGKYNININDKGSWEWSSGKKLSREQEMEIKEKFKEGATKSSLSREYNVSWGTIKNTIKGEKLTRKKHV